MPRAAPPDAGHGLFGAAGGGGQPGEKPAPQLAADEPRVAHGRARRPGPAGAGPRPQGGRARDVRADRRLDGPGSAPRGQDGLRRLGAESRGGERRADGGAAGGQAGELQERAGVGGDSGEDCEVEVGEEVRKVMGGCFGKGFVIF